MKTTLLIFVTFFLSQMAQAQVMIDSPEYDSLKINGLLTNQILTQNPFIYGGLPVLSDPTPIVKSTACDCYQDPDATYTLAMGPNDDGSTGLIPIPFNFCMYGTTYTAIYINNNGNLTFTNPLSAFSANAFPSVGDAIIAPFWGDVDTGGGNGQVLYKITPTAVYVNWVNVGYFSQQGDKLNTFQVTITDGSDPAVQDGNVAFCYKDMQWTTGSASQGVNGFGGVPATAGANKGDGVSFFLISRFDHPGVDFDGALGNPDGISWLDFKSFSFDVCNSGNVPPIPDGVSSCDTFKICTLGDTADISINFLSPEANQTTSITFNNGGLTSLQQIANISGNTASIILRAIGSAGSAGFYNVTVTATDNALPIPGVTNLTFVIQIDNSAAATLNPILTPLGGCDSVQLSVLNGPYDTYLWDDFTVLATNYLDTAIDYGVTVSLNGCYKRVHNFINVMQPITIGLPGPFTFCPPDTSVLVVIPDSLYYSVITWAENAVVFDNINYSNELGAGVYTIHLEDSAGYCTKDTTFSITTQPQLILEADRGICVPNYTFTTNQGGSGSGTWSTVSPAPGAPVFNNASILNPSVTFPVFGTYTLVYVDANCGTTDTVEILYDSAPAFNFDSDFYVCPGETEDMYIADSLNMSEMSWGITPPALDTLFSASLNAGTHTVNLVNSTGCSSDTTFTILTQPAINLNFPPVICGDTVEFDNNTGVSVGMWSTFNSAGTATYRDITDINTGLKVNAPGQYYFVFTESTCNDSDTIAIFFNPYMYVDLNDTIQICIGASAEVFANTVYPSYVDSVYWSNGTIGSYSTMANSPGYLYVTVENVCNSYSDSIMVIGLLCDFDLPNVITPNTDMSNDSWGLLNPQDIFKEFECVILNRWGNVIFTFDDPFDRWYGKDKNGEEVSDGVYFYTIRSTTFDDNEINKQGFIELFR